MAIEQTITAKIGKEGEKGYVAPMSIKVEKPETLEEAAEMYKGGEELILNYFWANYTVAAQSTMRTKMRPNDEGKSISAKKLQTEMDEWEPGIKARGRPVEERIAELSAKLTPEAKAELLKRLQAE